MITVNNDNRMVTSESYQKNYPDLEIVLDVPYDVAGSSIGVSKGNTALLAAVNEAIAAAIEDGSMDQFVAEANCIEPICAPTETSDLLHASKLFRVSAFAFTVTRDCPPS